MSDYVHELIMLKVEEMTGKSSSLAFYVHCQMACQEIMTNTPKLLDWAMQLNRIDEWWRYEA